jgi:hypothetical protein
MDETEIRDLVVRLSRPHPTGGKVIERAAILAAGAASSDIVRWIIDREGRGETAAARSTGGMYGAAHGAGGDAPPQRYVLPPGALD